MFLIISGMILGSCQDQSIDQTLSENPFFSEYGTPFEVPDFDKIKVEHYMPAFQKAIEELYEVEVEKVNVLITPNGEKKAFVKLHPDYKAVDVAIKLGIL